MARRTTGRGTTVARLIEAGWTPSEIAVEARLPGPGPVLRVIAGKWISLRTARQLAKAGIGLTLDGIADEIERVQASAARRGAS
jgi:hypothetical protein